MTAQENISAQMVEFTEEFKKPTHSTKTTWFFGFGAMTDQMSHQMFQFLIFTYYYAIVHIDLTWIMITFIVFAIWDSINDPLIGSLSDRTISKFGRRRFWTIISLVPFALVNILMFTPPAIWPGDGAWLQTQGANVAWMLFSIGLYDLFYTMFSISQTSLFSEMFKTEKERGRANKFKNILTIVGLLIGFVIPTILIPTLAPTESTTQAEIDAIPGKHLNTGIMVAVFVIIFGLIFIRFGSGPATQYLAITQNHGEKSHFHGFSHRQSPQLVHLQNVNHYHLPLRDSRDRDHRRQYHVDPNATRGIFNRSGHVSGPSMVRE